MRQLKENKILVVLCIILLIPLVSMFTKKTTKWDLSLKTEDKAPFGTFVFDSLMKHEFGSRYQYVQNTLYEIHQQDSSSKSIIVLADFLDLSSDDIEEIMYGARKGNKYILAANNFNEDICKKFNFEYSNNIDVNPFWFSENPEEEKSIIKIYDENNASSLVKIEVGIVNSYLYEWDTTAKVLLENENSPIAVLNTYNKGSVIICSSPYIFTNYFILDKTCWKVTDRLLQDFYSDKIIFAERYLHDNKNNASIFKNLLRYDALRYLLYFSLILILVYMIFTAKRKQRIIPIIKQPKNNSLEFIKLIGRLYFLKKNHTDICVKKFLYLKDYLHRTHQINFNEENEQLLYEKISVKTGINVKQIRELFSKMNGIMTRKQSINIPTLHKLVEEMEKYYIKK